VKRCVLALLLCGCPKGESKEVPRDRPLGAQRCSAQPGPRNTVLPVFDRPFDGHYPVANLFDHDLPVPDVVKQLEAKDQELTYCGLTALGLHEGYAGYAYMMPVSTPILAPASGFITFAGAEPAFACPLTGRPADDQLTVVVQHDGLGDIGYSTKYSHLAQLNVKVGDGVVAGQRLGISGRSGCASQPILYFEVKRLTGTKTGQPTVVDPYGWDGANPDPWAQAEQGATSLYLWKPGEAPTLKAR
jgi:murein DD-endopeptidase MepM/ murein hydrolase activator NlpD